MAEVPVIVTIGSDIAAGTLAELSEVSDADIERLYGAAGLDLTKWPMSAPMPGVRAWQHKRPYATVDTRNITAVSSNTITIDGTPLVSPTDVGTWLYIASNPTGQGQYKRITAIAGAVVTVHAAFNPPLTADAVYGGFGQVNIIRDSHRVEAGSTALRIFRHTDTPAFTGSVVDKFVLFFDAYASTTDDDLTRKIVAQDGVSITLDRALTLDGGLPGPPDVNTGFVVLTGAGAVNDLAGFANGAALRPLAINLDDAPVNPTGYVYNAWDTGTPFGSPLAELGVQATVVAATVNSVTVERPIFDATRDVGSPVKIGSETRIIAEVTTPSTVELELAVGIGDPTPPAIGDRLVLVRASVNMVSQLAWRMRMRFATPVVVAQLGRLSSMLLPFVQSSPTDCSWAHDLTTNDWHPSSPASLVVALKAMLTSVKTLLVGEGHTAKFMVCIECASNDAVPGRYEHIGEGMTVLRDAIRAHVEDPTVAWIMSGPSAYGATPTDLRPAIYEQLAAMKATDAWTSYVDTRDGIAKAPDGFRLSAPGQFTLADRFADALAEVLDRDGALPDTGTIVVEDGTGKADADSYLSVAEFRDMAAGVGNPAQITTASDATVKVWLRQSARHGIDHIFGQALYGIRKLETQALEWPRTGGADNRTQLILADSFVPPDWKWAQFWYAYALAQGIDVLQMVNANLNSDRARWATSTTDTLPGGLSESRTYGNGVPHWSILPRMLAAASPFLMLQDDSSGVA